MSFSYVSLVKTEKKNDPNTFAHIWNFDKGHQNGVEISREKEQIVQFAGDFFNAHMQEEGEKLSV